MISNPPSSVDTELPAATALADGESGTATVPRIGTYNMGLKSDGTGVEDRATLGKLHDLNTGASTEYNVGVNLRTGGASGSVETGVAASPLIADASTNVTIADGKSTAYANAGATKPITHAMLMIMNEGNDAQHYRVASAGLPAAGGFSNPNINTMRVGAVLPRDDAGTDTVSEDRYHYPRISAYRTQLVSKYDIGGNELAESAEATLLASAARTTTQTGADITNYSGFKYLHVVLDATAFAATPSIVLTIEGKDSASGKYFTILAGAAVTGVATNVYRVGPGITPAANATTDYTLPRIWRIVVTHADTDSITYSVGYSLTK